LHLDILIIVRWQLYNQCDLTLRPVMNMRTILITLLNLLAAGAFAQTTIQGYVYEDTNNNRKRDRKEVGIAGVGVSNGIDVVQTDANGFYRLNVSDDAIVFVIKPAGYATPVDAHNLPLHYYIHKPQGAPDSLKYKGVAPTGKAPKSVDFALYKQNEPQEFTILAFGDPQVYNLEEIEYLKKGIIAELEGIQDVVLGISLGDLVGDALDLHHPYKEAIRAIGIPWYNVMGNHDMNYDVVLDSLSDETFEKNFGPTTYSFNYGPVHFIILDDILYPDPRDGRGYWGGFRPSQLKFIENDLKLVHKDQLVVLSYHIPLQYHNNEFSPEDRQQLFDMLQPFPHVLTMCAHTHLQRNDFYTEADGWKGAQPLHEYNAGTTCGDWYSGTLNEHGVPTAVMRDGTPKGYAFVHFKNNQYIIDYKVAGASAEQRMHLHLPKVVPNQGWITQRAFLNYYMGSEYDKPEYRIDEGEWKLMSKVDDKDPAYVMEVMKWDTMDTLVPGRRSSNAVNSTHLWQAAFPKDLALGEHVMEVRVTDRYGRVFTEKKTFRITEPAPRP
jgi:hypothetical protein